MLFFINFQPNFLTRRAGIIVPKREQVTGEQKKLHNEELRNLYSPENIIGVIRSERMRDVWEVRVK
jgi:hypothetical protein